MGCHCRDEQIVDVNGRRVLLKRVSETFHFVRLDTQQEPRRRPRLVLVKALRDVGNHIPPDEEVEYGRILAEMFAVYCAVEPLGGCS